MNSLLKRTTTLICCFLFSIFSHAQHDFKEELKGSVRIILEESFEGVKKDSVILKNGKNRQYSWIQDNKMEFNRDNKLLKRSFYDDEKNHVRSESYEYENNVIAKKTIQGFTFVYKQNEKGLVSEEILISKTDTTDTRLKQRFRYNAKGLLTDVLQFDMRGGYVCNQKNTYDIKNRVIKETFRYKDGVEYKNYSYGADGKLNKVEWFDFQIGLMERITYSYSRGKKLHELWETFEGGKLESTIAYKFDRNENPISILEINKKRRIHDHEVNTYVYDLGNNWVTKTTAINENRYFIVERRIKYYL